MTENVSLQLYKKTLKMKTEFYVFLKSSYSFKDLHLAML